MNILILNGVSRDGRGETCRKIADVVANVSKSKGWNVTAFDLDGLNIKPCRGCFACWLKHPGTCAIEDDEEPILKAMAESDAQAWITPVTFGGYGPALKNALDRFIPNILPFFTKRRGEIHHPQRYDQPTRLLAFGALPSPDAEAERIFHDLVRRNALNLDTIMTESRIFYDGITENALSAAAKDLLQAAEEAR
jgi:multimeric flavodoxin WrbA